MTMAGQERPGTSFGFFRARPMAIYCIFQNRGIYSCNWDESEKSTERIRKRYDQSLLPGRRAGKSPFIKQQSIS